MKDAETIEQQAMAWERVYDTLCELLPQGWLDNYGGGTGVDRACNAIRAMHEAATAQAAQATRDLLAEETPQQNPWREAVLEALTVDCILRAEHENNPELALHELLVWEQEIALDPAVSREAQLLIAKGARMGRDRERRAIAKTAKGGTADK